MVGGFLFAHHTASRKGEHILKYLGPEKAHHQFKNIDNNTFCGQMTLSIYNNANIATEQNQTLVGMALLNNRNELTSLLNLKRDVSDQFIILRAYLAFGKDCLKRLHGQFSFVIYNDENKNVFGANSSAGGPRLLYYFNNEEFVASTELKCVLPFVPQRKLNKDFIIAHVQNWMLEPENSAYENILHLPHGCAFTVEKNEFKKWTYYVPGKIAPVRFKNKEEYYEAANALTSKIISGYVEHNLTPGIQMGSGLSSSQIAWNLRQLYGENLNAVSYILPPNYEGNAKDEKHLTEILQKELQLNLHYVNEPAFPEPFGNHLEKKFWEQDSMMANPIGSDHEVVYGKLKELGTQIIFTSGGKNFNWSASDVYSYWLLHFKWLKIVRRKAITKSVIDSMPKALFNLLKNKNAKKEYSILNTHLLSFKDADKLEQQLISALPAKYGYHVAGNDQLLKIAQWTYGMKKYMSAQERRYDCAFVNPLHDPRLLDFSVSIPADLHLKRNFGRELLKGRVPDQIRNNREQYSYPADMGERWWNLKSHLKEHFEAIKENDEVWEYIDRKKMLEKYRILENNAPYLFWRNERNHFSKTIILSRFLQWERSQNV